MLQSLQTTLARILTDPQFRDAALRGESTGLPSELQALDAARVEAFARQLATKRMRALQRALPLTMAALGAEATEWLERYAAACPPSEGPPGADGERFAGFVAGAGGVEAAGLPAWLADLARYEAARHAVRRAPIPARRERTPLSTSTSTRLTLGPAIRILDLVWDIPASLRSEGRLAVLGRQKAKGKGQKAKVKEGILNSSRSDTALLPFALCPLPFAFPQGRPLPFAFRAQRGPVFLILARAPERGDVRERVINRATWELLRRCDGSVPLGAAIAAVARELRLTVPEIRSFKEECLRTLEALVETSLLHSAAG